MRNERKKAVRALLSAALEIDAASPKEAVKTLFSAALTNNGVCSLLVAALELDYFQKQHLESLEKIRNPTWLGGVDLLDAR